MGLLMDITNTERIQTPDSDSNVCRVVTFKESDDSNLTMSLEALGYSPEGMVFSVYARTDNPTVKCAVNVCGELDSLRNDDLSYPSECYDEEIGEDWKRIVVQSLSPINAYIKLTFFESSSDGDGGVSQNTSVYFYKAQLEEGSEETEWTSAEADITPTVQNEFDTTIATLKSYTDDSASDLNSTIKTMMELKDDGLHLGNDRNNNEVMIDSDSVDIIQNGTTVASFSADGVKLNGFSEFGTDHVQLDAFSIKLTDEGGLAFTYG